MAPLLDSRGFEEPITFKLNAEVFPGGYPVGKILLEKRTRILRSQDPRFLNIF